MSGPSRKGRAVDYVWDIRNPDGGSMGMEFARGKSAPADAMLAHALPERATVEVRDDEGALVARGTELSADASTPMSRLIPSRRPGGAGQHLARRGRPGPAGDPAGRRDR